MTGHMYVTYHKLVLNLIGNNRNFSKKCLTVKSNKLQLKLLRIKRNTLKFISRRYHFIDYYQTKYIITTIESLHFFLIKSNVFVTWNLLRAGYIMTILVMIETIRKLLLSIIINVSIIIEIRIVFSIIIEIRIVFSIIIKSMLR